MAGGGGGSRQRGRLGKGHHLPALFAAGGGLGADPVVAPPPVGMAHRSGLDDGSGGGALCGDIVVAAICGCDQSTEPTGGLHRLGQPDRVQPGDQRHAVFGGDVADQTAHGRNQSNGPAGPAGLRPVVVWAGAPALARSVGLSRLVCRGAVAVPGALCGARLLLRGQHGAAALGDRSGGGGLGGVAGLGLVEGDLKSGYYRRTNCAYIRGSYSTT